MSADSIDVDLISQIHFCINSNNFLHYARGHRFSRLCSLFDLAKYVSTLSIIVLHGSNHFPTVPDRQYSQVMVP